MALGRLISKHDDGATIGYVEVNVVVVEFEFNVCVLALVQVNDNDDDGFDAKDDVEIDTLVEVTLICSLAMH